MIERWRHDASMASPRFSLTGQEASAEARFKESASKFRFRVVVGIVQQNMPNGVRLIDDKPSAPQQSLRDDVFVESLWRIGSKRIFADGSQELSEGRSILPPAGHCCARGTIVKNDHAKYIEARRR
jgi:hypothetical protein